MLESPTILHGNLYTVKAVLRCELSVLGKMFLSLYFVGMEISASGGTTSSQSKNLEENNTHIARNNSHTFS